MIMLNDAVVKKVKWNNKGILVEAYSNRKGVHEAVLAMSFKKSFREAFSLLKEIMVSVLDLETIDTRIVPEELLVKSNRRKGIYYVIKGKIRTLEGNINSVSTGSLYKNDIDVGIDRGWLCYIDNVLKEALEFANECQKEIECESQDQ